MPPQFAKPTPEHASRSAQIEVVGLLNRCDVEEAGGALVREYLDVSSRGRTSGNAHAASDSLEQIRRRPWRTGRDILMHGEDLARLREALGYERFVECIGVELGMSIRKAETCIEAYWEFRMCADTAGTLPTGLLFRLCEKTTPARVRDEVRERWRRGEMLEANQIETWVRSVRADEAAAAKELKGRLKHRRNLALRPRTLRARRKKERENERRCDIAYGILNNLERTEKLALASFLWTADKRACGALAMRLNGSK